MALAIQTVIKDTMDELLKRDPHHFRFASTGITYTLYQQKGLRLVQACPASVAFPELPATGVSVVFSTGAWFQPALARYYEGPTLAWEACLCGEGELFDYCSAVRWLYPICQGFDFTWSKKSWALLESAHFRVQCHFQTKSPQEVMNALQYQAKNGAPIAVWALNEFVRRAHSSPVTFPHSLDFSWSPQGGEEQSLSVTFPDEYCWEIPALRYNLLMRAQRFTPNYYKKKDVQRTLFALTNAFAVWGSPSFLQSVDGLVAVPFWVKQGASTLGQSLSWFLCDPWRIAVYAQSWRQRPGDRWYAF